MVNRAWVVSTHALLIFYLYLKYMTDEMEVSPISSTVNKWLIAASNNQLICLGVWLLGALVLIFRAGVSGWYMAATTQAALTSYDPSIGGFDVLNIANDFVFIAAPIWMYFRKSQNKNKNQDREKRYKFLLILGFFSYSLISAWLLIYHYKWHLDMTVQVAFAVYGVFLIRRIKKNSG